MTDRELLERAAKAAGYTVARWSDDGRDLLLAGVQEPWNPLTDDGDALRMAVKLRLNITFAAGLGSGHRDEFAQVVPRTMWHLAECGPLTDDPAAMIRRSIVRAAAALV